MIGSLKAIILDEVPGSAFEEQAPGAVFVTGGLQVVAADVKSKVLNVRLKVIEQDPRAAAHIDEFFAALQAETVGHGPFSGSGSPHQVLKQRIGQRGGEYPP